MKTLFAADLLRFCPLVRLNHSSFLYPNELRLSFTKVIRTACEIPEPTPASQRPNPNARRPLDAPARRAFARRWSWRRLHACVGANGLRWARPIDARRPVRLRTTRARSPPPRSGNYCRRSETQKRSPNSLRLQANRPPKLPGSRGPRLR